MGDKPVTMISDEEAKEPTTQNDEEDTEALVEPPDWLPDGWIMEVYRAEDGTIIQYYTSPISNYTFTMKSEVLEYLFSGTDERMLESKEHAAENTLQRQHEWLPKGWVMEVRAGGEKTDKMYKFYVHSITGVRLRSKQDVLLYINEAKVTGCDTNEQCDTSSEDNILAIVDFQPSGLPEGWVKELVYRKTKEGLIRRDPESCVSIYIKKMKGDTKPQETGKVFRRVFIQRTSLRDLYSFEISADMHESLRGRLTTNEKPYREPTTSSRSRRALKIEEDRNIDHSEDGDTSSGSVSPNESEEGENIRSKAAGKKKATSSKNTVSRPSGRPPHFRTKEGMDNQDAD